MTTQLYLRRNSTVPLTNDQIDSNFELLETWSTDAIANANKALTSVSETMNMYVTIPDHQADIQDLRDLMATIGTGDGGGGGTVLEFTPVRQGGGVNQTATQVNIGTNGVTNSRRLLLQTGSGTTVKDHGEVWPISIDGTAAKVPFAGVEGITEEHNAKGTRWISTNAPTSTVGRNGDIWYQV